MHIDAHQHFWRYRAKDYGWISNCMDVLKDDFLPPDLIPHLEKADINSCVAVQARQSDEETRWLIGLAEEYNIICGVVGWIDLCSPDLVSRLKSYEGSTWLRGFRHVLQDEKDDRFMMRSSFLEGVTLLGNAGYTYDILVFSRQLPVVLEFLEALPEMPLVIDHIAKPEISGNNKQSWADDLEEVAKFPYVLCKISGLVSKSDWDANILNQYLEHVLHCFGPTRIMFGSDWPVCNLAANYQQVYDLVHQFVVNNAPTYLDDIFGGNAARFYGIR
ncbi:MAG: amidohydrolase [Alphaproteobacteria bacterium]|nr:MAG: amidohydrolase [Alphaproteobacteria bacterium]